MKSESIYQKPVTRAGILAFTLPTIFMTLIQASYSMIDGIFVSNILGDEALSSLTLISPYFNFFIAIGAMFASGGSAVVMKKMGEGQEGEARGDFSTLTLTAVLAGLLFSTFFLLFTKPLAAVFGALPHITALCQEYLFAYSFFIIPQILFAVLQVYTIGSGRTGMAAASSLVGGLTNIVFDFILIHLLELGMTGAAIASGLGMLVPCVILAKGFWEKKNMLHFSSLRWDLQVLVKTAANGSSEFASNLVSGIVMVLFNARMLSIAGASGVAASTITFYVFGLMSALYMGYMLGISPLLSYFYGAGSKNKLKKIRHISVTFIGTLALTTTLLSVFGSKLLVSAFTRPGSEAYALAVNGNRLFSLALLFVGFNTFSSMLFTALSNGKVSAIIAFSRTFVFLMIAILVLPLIFGINGLWLSVPVSELLALALSGYFFKKYQKTYHY